MTAPGAIIPELPPPARNPALAAAVIVAVELVVVASAMLLPLGPGWRAIRLMVAKAGFFDGETR